MSPGVQHRQGLFFGLGAYGLWGLFPLYWPLLKPLGSLHILAHRVLWSLAALLLWLLFTKRMRWWKSATRAQLLWLTLASALIGTNWLVFIIAVNSGRVVETALGYYINPLLSVLLGVWLLGEKLRRAQWQALVIAFVAVLVLTYDYGQLPWVALCLAPTFALYGLVKKRAGVGAAESLSFETLLTAVPAALFLASLPAEPLTSTQRALLVGAGPATVLPLAFFSAAATRLPLSTLGLLQYVAPTCQFLIGVLVFHEAMSPLRWAGFALVWLALLLFARDGVRSRV